MDRPKKKIANKAVKIYSASVMIEALQVKTAMKYHFPPIRLGRLFNKMLLIFNGW